ncbi:hypothetical protein ACSBRB_01455 [Staphylococcus auricularis]|uniref:hypothetical protein n=1 Tax=Staphylococcus auricularis TaxID=29379 RepID=UPI003EBAECC6
MKKFEPAGSFLIDALISFSMIALICIVLLPFILQLNETFQSKTTDIEMKRILLASLDRYSEKELQKGIHYDLYDVYKSNQRYCIKHLSQNRKYCTKS